MNTVTDTARREILRMIDEKKPRNFFSFVGALGETPRALRALRSLEAELGSEDACNDFLCNVLVAHPDWVRDENGYVEYVGPSAVDDIREAMYVKFGDRLGGRGAELVCRVMGPRGDA